MSDNVLILAGLAAIVVAILFWKKVWPWWRGRIPKGWSIGPVVQGRNKSAGVKLEDRSFTFPLAGKSVHALLNGSISVKGKRYLRLRYRITAAPGVTFHPQENPKGRAIISIMLQRKGDYLYSGRGKHADDRIYSPEFALLTPDTHTLVIDLSNTRWHTVVGGISSPDQFKDVVDNLAAVHVCFGEEYANRAHGVFATGPARFALLGLD